MHLEGFDRYEEGDVIESFELEKIRPPFEATSSSMSFRIARERTCAAKSQHI